MKNADNARKMVAAAVAAMPRERTFQCGRVLTHATITDRSLVPESTRQKLGLIAAGWGTLDGLRQSLGRPLGAPDGLIAATALEYGLAVVTRHTKDFDALAVVLINAWLQP
jgi:hypothetical protein